MTDAPAENLAGRARIDDRAASPSSRLATGVPSPLTLGLVTCGGIGAFLFTVTYLLDGISHPGYDAWRQPISALSLDPGGWVQQTNFVVFGILMALSAAGWYRLLMPRRGGIWFPVFQACGGLCLIALGIVSVRETAHIVLAYALIIDLAQGCFAMGAIFARSPHWRAWAVYSYVSGLLILIFWGLFVSYPASPDAGVVERVSAGSHALWLCLITAAVVLAERRVRV
ncbi:MAG TPA: DUF998 domain-containing protein [Chloroflexota bacterium]|nr:DUF998 domain-containing protein [Chloroflexota bacterium]